VARAGHRHCPTTRQGQVFEKRGGTNESEEMRVWKIDRTRTERLEGGRESEEQGERDLWVVRLLAGVAEHVQARKGSDPTTPFHIRSNDNLSGTNE